VHLVVGRAGFGGGVAIEASAVKARLGGDHAGDRIVEAFAVEAETSRAGVGGDENEAVLGRVPLRAALDQEVLLRRGEAGQEVEGG